MSDETFGPPRALEKWMSRVVSGCTSTHLPVQPLPVIVEEAEAVEFVLWRRAAGVTAPAAHFMSRVRPGRCGLIRAAPAVSFMSRFRPRRRSLEKHTELTEPTTFISDLQSVSRLQLDQAR